MIGMGFGAFLTLFVISFIAAAVLHYVIRYRFMSGYDGFLAKWIVGWLGAWISSPVLGHWFMGVAISGQYIVPAFLGAFSLAFMATLGCKTAARIKAGMDMPESSVVPGMATGEAASSTRAA
jgi:uncharacterized membrane protein YeaQ/YmgE (transglycosylase-associated protein family)